MTDYTRRDMPRPTGVRIAGDRYQWLHAWRLCMRVVNEQRTHSSTNPGTAVGVECDDAGNLDDVVYYRGEPPNDYAQVKYAVDARTPINLEYLTSNDLLKKLVSSYRHLACNGERVRVSLITNRAIDPGDILLRDRDARDGRLVPRAAQGGPKSDRGLARKEWAKIADVTEADLLAFFEDFYLETSEDPVSLQREVSLLMTVNGLRSDEMAIDAATGWVARQVEDGHQRLSFDDIENAITMLSLQAGTPWTPISIATLSRDRLADQAQYALDWVDRIDGDDAFTKVAPKPPSTWEQLANDIEDIPNHLGEHRRLMLTGTMRQATGFKAGTVLRRVLGYEVGIRQGEQPWSSEVTAAAMLPIHHQRDIGLGGDPALVVSVTTDATDAVVSWIKRTGIAVGTVHTAMPVGGQIGPRSVPDPEAANALAVGIRDLARQIAAPAGTLHLFLAGPLGLALLLGHHWNRVMPTVVYEHLGTTEYVQAFRVSA
ncbi:SAVED domain-containing protein [Kribbella sp. NPDC051936]|uniref:SAVED domain-containing protein n=1 Tax=Kribbella sp. NPDC051936 TaxID=3154946 RepID=UPI0034241D9C